MTLTARAIERIETPTAGRIDYFDQDRGAPPGFGLRVSSSGKKTFYYMYRRGGALKRWTIGRYPMLSLADAREKARKTQANGGDPAKTKAEAKRAETFRQLSDQFLEGHEKKLKEKTLVEWKRIIDKELVPYFGEMKPHEIKRGDVIAFLEEKAKTAPYMANRIFEVIRRVFAWAVEKAKVDATPCVRIKKPGTEKQRERVLTTEEIRKVFAALKKERPIIASFFRMAFLTGARRGEILGAAWTDVDFDKKRINFRDAKSGHDHALPLSTAAVRVLQEIRPFAGPSVIFLGPSGKAIQHPAKAISRLRTRSGVQFRIHDVRRTVATGLAEIGVRPDVISTVLGHTIGGAPATRGYEHYHRIPEMASALEAWAAHLGKIISGKTEGADLVAFQRS